MPTPTAGSRRGTRATTLGVIALFVVVSAGAWNMAIADGHDQTIDACINPAGNVRIIEDGQTCRNSETAVSWSQHGPQGEPGQPGDPGPQGEPGESGPQGEPGTVDVNVNLLESGPSTSGAPIGYLEIPSIDGESTADGHADEMDVYSWSFGVESPATIGSGSGSGKATFKELTITKKTDSASPLIARSLVEGGILQSATLTVPRPGDTTGTNYLAITLEEVHVTGYDVSHGGANSTPTETITLDFVVSRIAYYQQLADGSIADPIEFSWNRRTDTIAP